MVAANLPSSVPERAPRASPAGRPHDRALRAALILVTPIAIATGLLSAEVVFNLPRPFMAGSLVVGAVVVAAMLLIAVRDLIAAEARADAALDRAASSEAIQRIRADELAGVLKASETLALTGDGHVDYLGVLSAITPDGATSFLVRTENEMEATVVAAHGPLATSVVGLHRVIGAHTLAADGASLASFSAAGHPVGVEIKRAHFDGFEAKMQAVLAVRLVDHHGRGIGFLHMLDPISERILDPIFVALAQLVGKQIAVAMENTALMARLRQELAANQRVGQQLLRASKMGEVGELAAAVAHEVNNPLTGILGFADLLLSELPAGDPRHDEVAVIRDEAVRARTIVRALLEFAQPRPPQRVPADLNDLARSTLELVSSRARGTSVSIAADYAELPCLCVDPDAVKQVFLNLFNNAIDAMPGGGTLSLSTDQVGERIRVAVSDTGVGMDDRTRSLVFTPFFSTRAADGEGTGLGLSVGRQIVESHGGTIEVESRPGDGAIFTVWLPASLQAFDGEALVPGAEPRPGDTAGPSAAQDSGAVLSSGCAGAAA